MPKVCVRIVIIREVAKSLQTSVLMLTVLTTLMACVKTATCLHTTANDAPKTKSLLKSKYQLIFCPLIFQLGSEATDWN